MDGVGKNSVIDALLEQFPKAINAEIWQPMYEKSSPFSSKQAVDDYLCSLSPEARSLFLAHALLESTQQALNSEAALVFLNAYYFKYFASERTLGASSNFIKNLISNFPKPDLVIQITCNPEIVVQRKKRFSRYECGCAATGNATDFVEFQAKTAENWSEFAPVIDFSLENKGTVSELVNAIIPLLKL